MHSIRFCSANASCAQNVVSSNHSVFFLWRNFSDMTLRSFVRIWGYRTRVKNYEVILSAACMVAVCIAC